MGHPGGVPMGGLLTLWPLLSMDPGLSRHLRIAAVSGSTSNQRGGRAGQGARREHPDLAAHPSRTSSRPGPQRQDIPTSPPHFPVGCRKGPSSSRGLTVNGTTCSSHSNYSAGQGHGAAGNRDRDTCSPACCREARARALQHSPRAGAGGLAAARDGQGVPALEGQWGCAALQLHVPGARRSPLVLWHPHSSAVCPKQACVARPCGAA